MKYKTPKPKLPVTMPNDIQSCERCATISSHLFCADCLKEARMEERFRRDGEWIEEAQKAFEGVRDPLKDPSLIEGWTDGQRQIPAFVLHEVWKRNPLVMAAKTEMLASIRSSLTDFPSGCDEGIAKEIERIFSESGVHSIANKLIREMRSRWEIVCKERDAVEQKLRYVWWAGHGHSGLYGDDGEMQCGRCRLDFKRDSLEKIEQKLLNNAFEEVSAYQLLQKDFDQFRTWALALAETISTNHNEVRMHDGSSKCDAGCGAWPCRRGGLVENILNSRSPGTEAPEPKKT